jgi:predicted enzyme related to lactoylglutathione lyase
MSTSTLSPRILGQAENAHRALLERLLIGTPVTYERWGALTLVAASDQVTERDMIERLGSALKIDPDAVRAILTDLTTLGLLTTDSMHVRLSDAGRTVYNRLRQTLDATVAELYGDMPADDLEVAGRVLTQITARVNAKLAALKPPPANAESTRPETQRTDNDSRIDYVEMKVVDIARAKAFYGTAFGWTFTDYGPNYCEFQDGRLTGGFTAQGAPQPGGPLVVLYADDLAAVLRRVETAGGRIAQPIFDFPGGQRFHFLDPEGYELAVWSNR